LENLCTPGLFNDAVSSTRFTIVNNKLERTRSGQLWTEENHVNFSHDSRGPNREQIRAPSERKHKASRLEPSWSVRRGRWAPTFRRDITVEVTISEGQAERWLQEATAEADLRSSTCQRLPPPSLSRSLTRARARAHARIHRANGVCLHTWCAHTHT
jgi:hypothetical protein